MLHTELLFNINGPEKAIQILNDLYIDIKYHETLPLMILNYSQIDSPKYNPIVIECRGLVLDKTGKCVAKGYNRFFNYGENSKETESFDFSDFSSTEKEDGTFILLFNYQDSWLCTTRKTFCNIPVSQLYGGTWQDLLLEACGLKEMVDFDKYLFKSATYVLELCSIYNKIVRTYEKPIIFLTSMFDGKNEYGTVLTEALTPTIFNKVKYHTFKNIEEVLSYIEDRSKTDITFEGVVIRDKEDNRLKIKSIKYQSLHYLKGNIVTENKLANIIFDGEITEFLTTFPEYSKVAIGVHEKLEKHKKELVNIWESLNKDLTQKDFALAIKDITPLSFILFNMRKNSLTNIEEQWSLYREKIISRLFT